MCRSVPRPFHPRSGASRLDHPTHSTRSDQGRGASSQQTIDGQCNCFSRPGPSTPDEPTRPTRVDRINLSPDSKLYGAPHFRKGLRTPKTRDLGPKTRFRNSTAPDSARNNTARRISPGIFWSGVGSPWCCPSSGRGCGRVPDFSAAAGIFPHIS